MISKRESPNLFSLSTEGGGVVRLGVTLRGKRVGTLAQTQNGLAAFEAAAPMLAVEKFRGYFDYHDGV